MKPLLVMIGALVLSACTPPKVNDAYQPCRRLGRTQECVVVPLAGVDEDGDAKRFAPPGAGKVRIYFLRPYMQEPKKKSRLYLDERLVAELAPKTFALLDVAPGQHRLTVQTDDSPDVVLDINASETTYVQYQLDLFLNTTTGKLTVLPADSAQEKVRQSRRVAHMAGT